MPHDTSTEASLAQAQETLKIVTERTMAIMVSIERCEKGNFETLPLMAMYKRPTFSEKDC